MPDPCIEILTDIEITDNVKLMNPESIVNNEAYHRAPYPRPIEKDGQQDTIVEVRGRKLTVELVWCCSFSTFT